MTAELDHVFICASAGGIEAARLVEFGLIEGPPNVHPGQGTACRRFPLANAFIELLWISDPSEAQSDAVRSTYLWERWIGRAGEACPFGIGFRPRSPHGEPPPFTAWDYSPPYLAESSLQVATNAHVVTEPMLFYLPFGKRRVLSASGERRMSPHSAGVAEITRLEFVSPHAGCISTELDALVKADLVGVQWGPEYLLEVGFDGQTRGQMADLRPILPLVLRW